MSTFENWAKQNLGVDEDGNIIFWRQKLSGRVRSAIGFTEFEECWQAALSSRADCGEFEEWWREHHPSYNCESLNSSDLVSHTKDVFKNLMVGAFLAGQKSKAATLKLPEKKPCLDLNAFANSELAIIHNARAEAYNAALDAVKSMNEGE